MVELQVGFQPASVLNYTCAISFHLNGAYIFIGRIWPFCVWGFLWFLYYLYGIIRIKASLLWELGKQVSVFCPRERLQSRRASSMWRVGSLTIIPLHGSVFPNYKETYINFSHKENNWLSWHRGDSDDWEILYMPFPSLPATSTVLLPSSDFLNCSYHP